MRQNVFLPCGHSRTGSIKVKIQRGHGRLKRRAFAVMALQRGALSHPVKAAYKSAFPAGAGNV